MLYCPPHFFTMSVISSKNKLISTYTETWWRPSTPDCLVCTQKLLKQALQSNKELLCWVFSPTLTCLMFILGREERVSEAQQLSERTHLPLLLNQTFRHKTRLKQSQMLMEFKTPFTVKQVKQFLDLTEYLHCFNQDYSMSIMLSPSMRSTEKMHHSTRTTNAKAWWVFWKSASHLPPSWDFLISLAISSFTLMLMTSAWEQPWSRKMRRVEML